MAWGRTRLLLGHGAALVRINGRHLGLGLESLGIGRLVCVDGDWGGDMGRPPVRGGGTVGAGDRGVTGLHPRSGWPG